ncbi:hypothetical protein LSAT2_032316 [Lamellibrachia satsuma]|nr:hypothetical protein LSAT2_032316 [Lamellibrachia satsuma]
MTMEQEPGKPTQIIAEWKKAQQQEGATFPTEIYIKFLDEEDKVVEDLITGDGLWQVKATLTKVADKKGTLLGNVTVDVVKGIATFDTLAISHIGTYDIVFQVVRPDRFNITVTLTQIEVVKREMTAEMTPLTATVDIPFSLSVTVKDIIGGKTVRNLDWQVDVSTSMTTFTNVTIDALGSYAIKVLIKSSAGSYSIMKRAVLRVITSQLKVVVKKSIQLKFAADFELIKDKQQQELFRATLENHFYKIYRSNQVIFSNFKFWQGSIATSFDAASSTDTALDGMLDAIASDTKEQKAIVFDGHTYQFEKSMLVDKKSYHNVEQVKSGGFPVGAIIAICVLLILILCHIILLVWLDKKKKKAKKNVDRRVSAFTAGGESAYHSHRSSSSHDDKHRKLVDRNNHRDGKLQLQLKRQQRGPAGERYTHSQWDGGLQANHQRRGPAGDLYGHSRWGN